jgi:four helix bundle protein
MLNAMRDYRKYDVWEKAHHLVLFVYNDILPILPKSEQYDLASQMKRAAYSIPMNIVEGCGRNTDKDFLHFLDMALGSALGSAHELEYVALLAFDLKYFDSQKHEGLLLRLNEVKAKLINLIKAIRKT